MSDHSEDQFMGVPKGIPRGKGEDKPSSASDKETEKKNTPEEPETSEGPEIKELELKQKENPEKSTDPSEESGDRSEDSGLGRPKLAPKEILPPEKTKKKKPEKPFPEELEPPQKAATKSRGLRIPGFVHSFNVILFIAMVFSILGILLLTQLLSAIQMVSHLPLPAQYIAYTAFGLMTFVVLIALLRFTWLYIRIPANRQISLGEFDPIEGRNQLRSVVIGRMEESRTQLKKYLEKYNLIPEDLQELGFQPEEIAQLIKKKDRLLALSEDIDTDTRSWIGEFKEDFQGVLDKASKRKIFTCAKITAIKTGINPNSFIDLTIVLYYSFQMVSDLCRIYNLRLGTLGTYYLLGKIFLHAYIASGLEETFEDLSEAMISDLKSRPILKHFIGKSAEALANGMIIRRLGRVTMKQLCPVAG